MVGQIVDVDVSVDYLCVVDYDVVEFWWFKIEFLQEL